MTKAEILEEFMRGCSVGPPGQCPECLDGFIKAIGNNDLEVKMSNINRGRCDTCHVEMHWNKDSGDEVACGTSDCPGRVTPYGAMPPGPEIYPVQSVDIHIEKVGDLMTASINVEGFSEETVTGFVKAVEGIVGPGNVQTDLDEPIENVGGDDASHSAN